MECKGFLFDLDGTLVDSLPAVERAWVNWAKRRGVDPQDVLDFIHGKQAITSLRHFMPGESEAAIQQEFLLLEQVEAQDTEGVTALPGAAALLARLNQLDIPWAIVTSGSIPVATARRNAGGLPQPEVFITAEQVKRASRSRMRTCWGLSAWGWHRKIVWWWKTPLPAFFPGWPQAAR